MNNLTSELSEKFQKYRELYNYDTFNEKIIEKDDQFIVIEEVSNNWNTKRSN